MKIIPKKMKEKIPLVLELAKKKGWYRCIAQKKKKQTKEIFVWIHLSGCNFEVCKPTQFNRIRGFI